MFENSELLRKNGITDDSIMTLMTRGIDNSTALIALEEGDVKGLGLGLEQQKLLWKLIEELKRSSEKRTKDFRNTVDMVIDEMLDKMKSDDFKCLFQCLLPSTKIWPLLVACVMFSLVWICSFIGTFPLRSESLCKFANITWILLTMAAILILFAAIPSIMLYTSNDLTSIVYDLKVIINKMLRAFVDEKWKGILYTLFGDKFVIRRALCSCEHCFD